MTLKQVKKSKRLHRGDYLISFFLAWVECLSGSSVWMLSFFGFLKAIFFFHVLPIRVDKCSALRYHIVRAPLLEVGAP